jgi:hypothetical protein
MLNDFLYLDSDPHGMKCPLGSHVRRSNPRDTGRLNNVRRHRLLRRGIAYGGPLLDENRLGDGRRRGMLFIAMNARIDMQFELLQSGWLNAGEFLGQTGLDRCPITGSHNGGIEDRFLEAGKGVPVTGLQRFVINRGGDYFFLPGLPGLREIAGGNTFPPDPCLPFDGRSMVTKTPELLDLDRLTGYAARILYGKERLVKLEFKEANGNPQRFVFAALHQDVTSILALDQGHFSVEHYNRLARVLTAGGTMIVAEIPGEKRDRLLKVLGRAWSIFNDDYCGGSASGRIRATVRDRIDKAIRRTEKSGRIDLVHDLGVEAAYGIVKDVYGLPGPEWVTELAISLPFGKRHVGEVPPDWLKAFSRELPDNPGLVTSQVWSVVLMLALLGNNQSFRELDALAVEAGSEMLIHLTGLIHQAAENPAKEIGNRTLLGAFIQASSELVKNHPKPAANATPLYDTMGEYLEDVRAILLEIVGTSIAAIPLTFSKAISFIFKHDIRLSEMLAAALSESGAEDPDTLLARFIYECERIDPNLPVMKRVCTQKHDLPAIMNGSEELKPAASIDEGDIVFAIVKAANGDPLIYKDTARSFSLKASERPMDKYLLFGATGSGRDCWGRDRVSMVALKELVQALTRFEGLRPVAGPAGEPETMLKLIVGLKARFTGIA